MNNSVTINDLKNNIALKDLPDQHLEWILAHSSYEEHEDGDIIVKTGEPIDEMIFFLEGMMNFYMNVNGQLVYYHTISNNELTGDSLDSTMSHYLIEQVNKTNNITVIVNSQVTEVIGKNSLECLTLKNIDTKEIITHQAGALFIFIGARPKTDWIKLNIIKDVKGFIETGRDLMKYESFKKNWKIEREPYLLETCIPGIFAAGDIRSGSMNRVASAVGEGAMAIKLVHEYLLEV